MRYLILAAVAAATTLSGGIAYAMPQAAPAPPPGTKAPPPPAGAKAPQPGGPMRGMMRADQNRDGVITRDEAIAAATRKFDHMDANHDGRLDQAELAAGPRGKHRDHGRTPPPPPADDSEG